MNATTAHITETSILIVAFDATFSRSTTVATEARPASLAEADTFLAFHSFRRTSAWDLGQAGSVSATVAPVDNRFNGTVAARLDQAVGTTHDEFQVMFADQAQDGDLIGDMELCGWAVVAGSRNEGNTARIHMVSEGNTWAERYSTDFPRHQLVQVARKR